VFTAESDPLRDEGEVYAAKLQVAGVLVEVARVAGAPHLFPALDGILKAGRQYNKKVIATTKRELKG
jgi:acetyl esterase/lipase